MVSSEWSSLINNYDYSFTIPEIRTALSTSPTNKAPGSDNMPTRVLQICQLYEDLLNLLNSHSILCYNRNTIPDKWKNSNIASISKNGNSSSLANQRGIAKSCNFAKLTSNLLLARIRDNIESQLVGVRVVFILNGQQLNKQWPYVTYLTCAVYQSVWPPSFLSTAIKLLISLTDVVFR